MKQIKLEKFEVVNLDYRTVIPLQGKLKRLSHESERKLLESLKAKGKFVPEFVWYCSDENAYYTLDGHSRLKIYAKYDIQFDNGYEIPFLSIQALSKQDAKEKLLLINSDYGKITQEGLLDFVKDFDISAKWMSEHLDMSAFSSFDFVDEAKKINMNLGRDLLQFSPPLQQGVKILPPMGEQPPAYEPKSEQPAPQLPPIRQPRASDDDFHSITEIVPYRFKQKYVAIKNRVMAEKGFAQHHEAFEYMLNQFEFYEYGQE